MDMIPALQILWRQRVLVAVGLLVSIALGIVVAFRVSLLPPKLHSRQYEVGVASVGLLVDTPKSTIADLSPLGADGLAGRASLLANVIATTEVEARVAALAGIKRAQLLVVAPSSVPPLPTAIGQAAQNSRSQAAPYRLAVATDQTLPIITITAQAPDRLGAVRLTTSAVTALSQYLDSIAVAQAVPSDQRPVLTSLGVPVSGLATRGTRGIHGVLAAVLAFALWVAVLVFMPRLRAVWALVTAGDGQTARPGPDERAEWPAWGTRPTPAHGSSLETDVMTGAFAEAIAATRALSAIPTSPTRRHQR